MSYVALYRKYRPKNFSSVVGQDTTVTILKNSIKNQHISHAYLFTGPRGTGKTSIAKIFAHAVNCVNFDDDICGKCEICKSLSTNDIDILEIDAASNNGVEEIRTLRDNVKLLPSFCKYKVYIIDEVHMLSQSAFNALLKTLEEPPSHVIFILATTEPHKVPVTILSRCQRFDFNKIDSVSLINRLKFILNEESRVLSDDSIEYISKITDGCLRDAINLLDQVLSLSDDNVTVSDIEKLSGKISKDLIFKFLDCLISADYSNLLDLIEDVTKQGKSYSDIVNNMLIVFRDISINNIVKKYFDENYSKNLSNYFLDNLVLVSVSKVLNELSIEMKSSNDQRLLFEIYMMHLVDVINSKPKLNLSYQQSENKKDDINIENSVIIDKSEQILIKEDNNRENIQYKDDNIEAKVINEINSVSTFNLDELWKIRINNVFAGANKDILNKILSDYDNINDYISSKVYNTVASLLLDGKVIVASDSYLMFSFDDETSINIFESNYKQVELLLSEIYNNSFKVVAITQKRWEELRKEFIFNKKNNIPYVLIDENDVKLEVSEEVSDLENSAMNIFGEDTVSVR